MFCWGLCLCAFVFLQLYVHPVFLFPYICLYILCTYLCGFRMYLRSFCVFCKIHFSLNFFCCSVHPVSYFPEFVCTYNMILLLYVNVCFSYFHSFVYYCVRICKFQVYSSLNLFLFFLAAGHIREHRPADDRPGGGSGQAEGLDAAARIQDHRGKGEDTHQSPRTFLIQQ